MQFQAVVFDYLCVLLKTSVILYLNSFNKTYECAMLYLDYGWLGKKKGEREREEKKATKINIIYG